MAEIQSYSKLSLARSADFFVAALPNLRPQFDHTGTVRVTTRTSSRPVINLAPLGPTDALGQRVPKPRGTFGGSATIGFATRDSSDSIGSPPLRAGAAEAVAGVD
jgi:hypothetical protein